MNRKIGTKIADTDGDSSRVRLGLTHATAQEVCIAGSFNDWHPSVTPMDRLDGGKWRKELSLAPGRYEYRFAVDVLPWSSPLSHSSTAKQAQHNESTTMKTKHILGSGIAVALALVVWLPGTACAADSPADHAKKAPESTQWQRITTLSQAEALKPGDSMSMTCIKCKSVMIQKVTADKAHVKMMTVGERMMCHSCDGTVEVVATGKGKRKNTEVKHVCSKCGDDAMFCSAGKPASGTMKDMPMEKK